MEEYREVSVDELIQETVDMLLEISVPVKYAFQISRPLDQAVKNLQSCLAAFKKAPEKAEGGEDNVQV